jgi:hypothetical protein
VHHHLQVGHIHHWMSSVLIDCRPVWRVDGPTITAQLRAHVRPGASLRQRRRPFTASAVIGSHTPTVAGPAAAFHTSAQPWSA